MSTAQGWQLLGHAQIQSRGQISLDVLSLASGTGDTAIPGPALIRGARQHKCFWGESHDQCPAVKYPSLHRLFFPLMSVGYPVLSDGI